MLRTGFLAMALSAMYLTNPAWATPKDSYPDVWWEPVDRTTAPDWEVLPQDADRLKGEVILSKRNELGILSNFSETPFKYQGKSYRSVEGFWQMMKYPEGPRDPRNQDPSIKWPHSREEVSQMVAFEAKAAGDAASENMKKLGIDWVSFDGKQMAYHTPEKGDHYKLIVAVMWEKVKQNAKVKEILLQTGDLKLFPDHQQDADASPAWRYYDIYMEIRTELQNP